MINSIDTQTIINAIESYRVGSPITIYDVRVAADADGSPIDHIAGQEIALILATCCDPKMLTPRERRSWIRRC